ncbi:hypothetical protein OAG68_00025 [bacterium]|nr:hypothetical protein [bacterium]
MMQKEYLNEQDAFFCRMQKQHTKRVEEIKKGNSPLSYTNEGILVVHLFPHECQLGRSVFSGAQLKAAGAKLPPLGRNSQGNSKFNVDGLLNFESWNEISTYSQIYRDGHVEGVATRIAWENCRDVNEGETPPKYLRETTCEEAMLGLVPASLDYFEAMDFEPNVWCFSSVIDCKDARVGARTHWHDEARNVIDRTPAHLPEFIIESKDCAEKLRGWCDSLWQAGGLEASPNFNENGEHRPARR